MAPSIAVLTLACLLTPPPAGAGGMPAFVDRTEGSGIRFVHVCGSAEKDYILEVNGSGVLLFDSDGDSDLDLYFPNGSRLAGGGPPARDALYRNEGGLRFSDTTSEAGLGDEGWTSAAAAADVDNDGDLDLFLANWGPDVLYLNEGGKFRKQAGSGAEDPRWGGACAFGDVDSDGRLDLYVANYLEFDPAKVRRRGEDPSCVYKGEQVFCGPLGLPGAPDSLFINAGLFINTGAVKFEDRSSEWGIRQPPAAYGLGVLFLDANRDGRPDIFVANDTMPNNLFMNEGGRRFLDAGLYLGVAYNEYGTAQACMGVAAAFIRDAGREDLFITNYEDDTNTYYQAAPGGFYTDATWPSGLGEPSYKYLGWGTFFFDADLDGRHDVFVANGHLMPQADRMRSSPGYRQPCHMFRGDGAGRFEDWTSRAGPGLSARRSFRGAAFGDLDGDGDQDIVVTAIDDRPLLLENRGAGPEGAPLAAWIALRLRGTRSNRDALGARVELTAGGRLRAHYVRGSVGYASQSESLARFGLAEGEPIERLRVQWPSGLVEEFPPPAMRKVSVLEEGAGRRVER